MSREESLEGSREESGEGYREEIILETIIIFY